MSAAVEGIVRDIRIGALPAEEARARFGYALLAARDAAITLTHAPAMRLRHTLQPTTPTGGSMALSAAWDEFEAERKADVASRTLIEIQSVGRRLVAAIDGKTAVSSITRPMLVRLRDEWAAEAPNKSKGMEEGRIAAGTLVKRMRLVGTFLGWCVERGLLDRNPATKLALPDDTPQIERRGFSDDELRIALSALTDDPETLMLARLGMYTGCRLGELTGLRRSDIVRDDRQQFSLRLRAHEGRSLKSKSSARVVPVPAVMGGALGAWMGERREALFARPASVASKRFNRALRRVQLPRELVFHSLRHGVAERLRAAGVAGNSSQRF